MDYVVTQSRQIAVTADSPEEAQKKILDGEGATISSNLSASPRLQPQAQTQKATPQIPAHLQPKSA